MVISPTAKRSVAVRDAVVAMAQRLGADHQMPTSRELARTLRVSSSTLHPILKELDQQGILSLQHGRGIFVGNAVAQKSIGVVFGGDIFNDRFSPFWNLLLQAVRKQSAGFNLVPRTYMDLAGQAGQSIPYAQLVEDVDQRRVHGLLLFSMTPEQLDQIQSLGLPMVGFGQLDGYCVFLDIPSACRAGTKALIAKGCRNIALMGHGVLPLRPLLQEEPGANGLLNVADWSYETWAWRIAGAGSLEHCAHQMARRLIAERANTPLPDGILSIDDTMTRGVIHAMHQAGLLPGRDLQIASVIHRGSPILELFANEVIPLEFDPARCVKAILSMLSDLISGRIPANNSITIPVSDPIQSL